MVTPTKKIKRLWYDPCLNRVVQLTHFEPATVLPRHRHIGNELIYVLEGEVTDESGTVLTGGMSYRPAGCVHTVTSRNGATLFAIVTGASEDTAAAGPGSHNFVLSDLPWMPVGAGVFEKLVWPRHDEIPRAALLRIEPGANRYTHFQGGEEFVFVIEGSYSDDRGVGTGDLQVLPPGFAHSITTRNGVTALSLSYGV